MFFQPVVAAHTPLPFVLHSRHSLQIPVEFEFEVEVEVAAYSRTLECKPVACLQYLMVHDPRDFDEGFRFAVPFLIPNTRRTPVDFAVMIELMNAVPNLTVNNPRLSPFLSLNQNFPNSAVSCIVDW